MTELTEFNLKKCHSCRLFTKVYKVDLEFEGRIFNWLCEKCKCEMERLNKQNEKEGFLYGKKFDEGKPNYLNIFELLDWDFLQEFSEVMEHGKKLYGFENWKKKLDKNRIKKALIRHLKDYLQGEEIDKDSGKSHLSHIACNIMFLYYYDHLKNHGKKKNS